MQINARRYDVTGSGAVFDTAMDWQVRRAEQWTTQRTTRSAQHAAHNMQRAAEDRQHATRSRQDATDEWRRPPRSAQHATEGTRCNAARRVASQFGPTNFNNKYGTTKKFYRLLRSAAAGTAEGVVRGHAACRR